ncbi:MAG: NAD(P)-binding protein [Gemmatimonadaceae bacterium]|nr:NAD(P)-binding protein [Gemmatimonadaceae bacterium]
MSRDRAGDVSRRDAVRTMAGMVAAPALIGLARKGHVIAGGFVDDGGAAGHRVRDAQLSTRSGTTRRTRVAIVGGGIGGLSAGWRLDALGMHDGVLLELDANTGGNTRSAHYRGLGDRRAPWGAHYLPIPDADATHVRTLMRELGVLQADGTWDERALCHAPQERIWQHGRWHEGLDPLDAATSRTRDEFAQFSARIGEWRESGMFRVPSAAGHARRRNLSAGTSADRALVHRAQMLDGMTAREWMSREGWQSEALRWWVEYGTRDDYGASLSQASAWAAVHYFASRPAEDDGPLTWPEGNDWIARQLAMRLRRRSAADGGARVVTGAPVFRLESRGAAQWRVHAPDLRVDADVVIWAAPSFVLPRVLPSMNAAPAVQATQHAPWVVANLVLDGPPRDAGTPAWRNSGTAPAWDNVLFGSNSLGYVNAGHQLLQQRPAQPIWTWYHALVDGEARDARRAMLQQPWSHWRDVVVADLSRAHPDIAQRLVRVDVMRWGHAMARPVPGVLARRDAMTGWQPASRVHLAHADVSGFSLFEEAQWQGVQAAEAAARDLGGDR